MKKVGTEGQRDRETERQRDRETERQRDRETESQRDREIITCFMLLGFWVFGFICPSIDDHDYKESSAAIIFNVLFYFLFGPVLIRMCKCVGGF